MFCSVCRGKSTKKRQQQGDDDKIEPQHVHDEIQKLRTKTNPPEQG
jgi:hypothetical protein